MSIAEIVCWKAQRTWTKWQKSSRSIKASIRGSLVYYSYVGLYSAPIGYCIWVFPKIVVPQNGWFIMENPMNKWMIWGGFTTPIFGNTHILWLLYSQMCMIVDLVVSVADLCHTGRVTESPAVSWNPHPLVNSIHCVGRVVMMNRRRGGNMEWIYVNIW